MKIMPSISHCLKRAPKLSLLFWGVVIALPPSLRVLFRCYLMPCIYTTAAAANAFHGDHEDHEDHETGWRIHTARQAVFAWKDDRRPGPRPLGQVQKNDTNRNMGMRSRTGRLALR
ncbi:hypothetical protein B0H67DRAFT_582999 [Lasiosphaeris hirsuta]|uniref:Uncharacterized protein n=1 Tax=Lasiosphaeris hirsuta TaxID=260670 RepID=A0AA40DX79_9PEZI|nr:hypothetical protein B0H67DRAFT_582999 [Lasiosphaeris hirsuta]